MISTPIRANSGGGEGVQQVRIVPQLRSKTGFNLAQDTWMTLGEFLDVMIEKLKLNEYLPRLRDFDIPETP